MAKKLEAKTTKDPVRLLYEAIRDKIRAEEAAKREQYGARLSPQREMYRGRLSPKRGMYRGRLSPKRGMYRGRLSPQRGMYRGRLSPQRGMYRGRLSPQRGLYGQRRSPVRSRYRKGWPRGEKYERKQEPFRDFSVSQAACGYWAERVHVERDIELKWRENYKYLLEDESRFVRTQDSMEKSLGAEKRWEDRHGCICDFAKPPKRLPPLVRSDIREGKESRMLPGSLTACCKYDAIHAGANISGHRKAVGQGITVKGPGDAAHAVCSRQSDDRGCRKPISSSICSSDFMDKRASHKPDGHVAKPSMLDSAYCLDELKRHLPVVAASPMCPKCKNRMCNCVPKSFRNAPADPQSGLDQELPPWPPQVWCAPSYSVSKNRTSGDMDRLRFCLRRDLKQMTPGNYADDKSQLSRAAEVSKISSVWRTAREAAYGPRFDRLR